MIDNHKYSNEVEILNWIENCSWTKISTLLPFPMYAFTLVIYNEYFYIVGFSNSELYNSRESYIIPYFEISKYATVAYDAFYYADIFDVVSYLHLYW